MSNFKPHLACDADISKVKYPCLVLPKIDGVRALVIDGVLVGRSLKKHKNKAISRVLSNHTLEGVDMEVISGSNPVADNICANTTSLMNTVNGSDNFTAYIFDLVNKDTIHLPYSERLDMVENAIKEFGDDRVKLCPSKIVYTEEELLKYEKELLTLGYEGVIVRDINGMHKNGRCTVREGNYLRIKRFIELNALVVGIEEQHTNNNESKINELGYTERSSHKENKTPNGMVGSLNCILLEDLYDFSGDLRIKEGSSIKVSFSTTNKDRKYYYENQDELIGRVIKFKSFPVNVLDKPRFPTFERFVDGQDLDEDVLNKVREYGDKQ